MTVWNLHLGISSSISVVIKVATNDYGMRNVELFDILVYMTVWKLHFGISLNISVVIKEVTNGYGMPNVKLFDIFIFLLDLLHCYCIFLNLYSISIHCYCIFIYLNSMI